MHMDGKTMLRTRGILSAELVSFRKGKDGKVIEGPARIVQDTDGQNLAHNFPRLMNNTLEFLMIRHVWLE